MPLPLATPGCGKNSKKAKQIQPSYSKITSQTEEQSVLNHALLAVSEQYGISKYYGWSFFPHETCQIKFPSFLKTQIQYPVLLVLPRALTAFVDKGGVLGAQPGPPLSGILQLDTVGGVARNLHHHAKAQLGIAGRLRLITWGDWRIDMLSTV